MSSEKPEARPATYLPLRSLIKLDYACTVVKRGFLATPYIVGSVMERPDYRDVDVRVMLEDDEYDELFADRPTLWPLICLAVSDYLSGMCGEQVDFQVQRRTDANAEFDGIRNPVGQGRDYAGYVHAVIEKRRAADQEDTDE